ncbi:MAG: PHP domain-containing protein [Clostridia bacterium]|nr:PHP domain-containing protein [Clostridia bacterium]
MTTNLPAEIKAYLDQYKYKIELHAHTSPASGCSELVPAEFIERLKATGCDTVCVTNHFFEGGTYMGADDPVGKYLEDFYKTKEFGEAAGMTVILGAEYRFHENCNDYLVYGIDEAFLRETVTQFGLTFREFYEKYNSPDRLILQAHPFRNGIEPIDGAHMDAIEAFNLHPGHNSRVTIASRYAQQENIPIVTIGTDLHHRGHEGTSSLRAKVKPQNGAELVALLRSKDYVFELGGRPLLPYYIYD